MLALLLAAVAGGPAQDRDIDQDLLLPTTINEADIEMRGRYAQQWKEDDGTLVVLYQGDFQLGAGRRSLASRDAVVWVRQGRSEPDGRRYWDLTVFLWGDAEVKEASGTVTVDDRLLVSNLRTFGRVVKHQDAHGTEPMIDSPLYQQAIQDRALIQAGRDPHEPPAAQALDVARPTDSPMLQDEKPPRVISYRLLPTAMTEPAQTPSGETVQVVRGRVYFAQSGGGRPLIEIRADNAVVFPTKSGADVLFGDQGATTQPAKGEPAGGGRATEEDLASRVSRQIRGVYLEGDVVLSAGTRFIRADRLYYDFESERALILDAVLRAEIPQREIPLYIRADEVRQLSSSEYRADKAKVSTSEFFTPSYHVGAERVYLRDTSERDVRGHVVSDIKGVYEMHDATLNVAGLPIAYWPYGKGSLEESETAIKSFRTAYSDDFGAVVESRWHLFNLLGFATPPGFDSTLRMDYFSKRGPALGVDLDYDTPDYFGLLRAYGMHDTGEDSLGPLRDNEPESEWRGRTLLRHRHYLPDDWQATFEVSYIGDPNFLEEYEKSEFHEGKEQETLFYLKRARETDAITLLANWRLLDFVTQTEHLPDLTYRRIGDTWLDPVVLYHESRVGVVRYRPDDRRFFDTQRRDNTDVTGSVFRTDAREEAEVPLKFGPLNLVPFATLRGSVWDEAPNRDGGLWRGLGSYGVRGSTQFSRNYDGVVSELLDINRIRHIIKPDFAAWFSHSNARSTLITPFDEGIETIDDFYGVTLGLRQVFQTKRGAEGRRGTVDLLTLNLEMGLFGGDVQENERSTGYANPLRPEDSRSRNYVAADAIYRLSDTTSLLYDINYDLNDQQVDRQDLSIAVERLPRLAYVLGLRYAGDIDMNLVGGGFNYRLNEKHIVAARSWFDIDRGDLGEVAVSYIKKLPRWYFGVNLEFDQVDDDVSISVSLWPEGIPEWTLGSRRFTGLGTSTGIRP